MQANGIGGGPTAGVGAGGVGGAGGKRGLGPLSPDKLQGILDAAQMLAGKGKKAEAFAKYKEILESDPAQPEALAWAEEYLRSKRDYAQLRDVLLASVRYQAQQHETIEARKERLREVAGLCEGNLRDVEGAVGAWKQLLAIDRTDESARTALTRLLEKTQRWDDLANLLEQEATAEHEVDTKIALEKKLATLQEQKRRDFVGAAEAWARIMRLSPDDDRPIATAAKLYEKAGRLDLAAQILTENVASVEDTVARGQLFERLGEIKDGQGDSSAAGEAYAEAAEILKQPKLWESAERSFLSAELWAKAAGAVVQRALLTGDAKGQAQHYARAADMFFRAGDEEGALEKLEHATDLDPLADEYAILLSDRLTGKQKWDRLVAFLAKRGDRLLDPLKRVAVRRQAAQLYASQLGDKEAARWQWLKVLEDGDDKEALEKLIDYAVEREDHTEATTLLRRLFSNTVDKSEKARVALREAELLADGVGDVDMAIHRYEEILGELDPTCRPALQAIADLQEARENAAAAADAL
jgi:tetratricopeptide (TPR) repeat protein